MNLENIMPGEKSQTQNAMYYDSIYMKCSEEKNP